MSSTPIARRLTLGLGLGFGLLTPSLEASVALAQTEPPSESFPAATSAAPASQPAPFEAAAAEGVRRFRAGDRTGALQAFDQALALSPPPVDQATIEANAAACLFELGRYDEAEVRFVRSAELDPSQASLARLDAGFAALRAGRLDAAEAHLRAAPPGDAEAEARRADLRDQLARARTDQYEAERRGLVEQGATALRVGNYQLATIVLERALQLSQSAPPAQVADIHYGLGTAWFELGDYARARVHFEAAATLVPTDGDYRYQAARAALRQGDTDAGVEGVQQALRLGLEPEAAEQARAELERHDQLPRSGLGFWASVGGGYDSNPAQSGVADATGMSSQRTDPASPFAALGAELRYTGRLGTATAGRLYYALDGLFLVRRAVRDLSLQSHEAGGRLYVAASQSTLLRFSAAPSLQLAGLENPEPFTLDLIGEARVDFRTGAPTLTRVKVEARAMQGLEDRDSLTGVRDDRDYLNGVRVDAEVSERLRLRPWEIWLGAGFRYHGIGTRTFPVDANLLPGCRGERRCEDADYLVPLGYLGPTGFLDVTVEATDRLTLGISASVAWRRYLEESRITGFPESRKRREDLRLLAGPNVELALDDADHFLLVADYQFLSSQSNVALDDDPEHDLDYDDRSYTQHVVEAGLEVAF